MSIDIEPLLPFTEDLDTGGFWQAARNDTLALCACAQCDEFLHLPKRFCHRCGSWDTYWREVPAVGILYSWTVTTLQLHPAFPVPYTVVLVEVDNAGGAKLIGRIKGTPQLTMGMVMKARFEKIDDGVTLVEWEPQDTD